MFGRENRNLTNCMHCGGYHANLTVYPIEQAGDDITAFYPATHFAVCPTTQKTILLIRPKAGHPSVTPSQVK